MEEAKVKCTCPGDYSANCSPAAWDPKCPEHGSAMPFNGGGFDMPDLGDDPDGDIEGYDGGYMAGKLEERGYPGLSSDQTVEFAEGRHIVHLGPSTSQADEIMKKAGEPAMYAIDQAKAIEVNSRPAVWIERIAEDKVTYEIHNIPNEQALRIMRDILPKVMELYLGKSRDYGGNVMDMLKLGPKASFVDLWRKVGKLKRALWDGHPMVGEQTEEILMDCVGHILITLDEMRKE